MINERRIPRTGWLPSILLPALLLVLCPWGAALAQGASEPPKEGARQTGSPEEEGSGGGEQSAAEMFKQANALYYEGKFKEALALFSRANLLAPHHATLFSIARCHENLGEIAQALEFYGRAVKAADGPQAQEDIRRRMARLSSRPVKVFVSSKPSGARLTVDGREKPEPGATPTVVALVPGEHVLLLRHKGHQLAARRVVVEPGKEQAVEVPLTPLPGPAPAPAASPKIEYPLEEQIWRFQLTLNAPFGFGARRPFTIGAGIQALAAYKRFVFGGRFWGQAMVIQEIPPQVESETSGADVTTTTYDRSALQWYLGQAVAGYMVPFKYFFLRVDVGLGVSYEQVTFQGDRKIQVGASSNYENVKESSSDVAFAWSIGGAIEAMAVSWLSVGFSAQVGMVHGKRQDLHKPTDYLDSTNFMYGTISAVASFHLL